MGGQLLTGENLRVGEHRARGIFFQPIKPVPIDHQQMTRIFSRYPVRTPDVNRLPAGRMKPLPVPSVEVLVCANPNAAAGVCKYILNFALGDSLLHTIRLKPRTKKPVDTVFRSHPQKAGAVGRQRAHRQVLEPLGLLIGVEDVLLRLDTDWKQ